MRIDLLSIPAIALLSMWGLSTVVAESIPGSYDQAASRLLLDRAQQISASLRAGNYIPEESFADATTRLEGESVRPWGSVRGSRCDFAFRFGSLNGIARIDLFEDKGPDSLILRHLTNEVLTLKTQDAASRALDVLKCLSFDVAKVRKVYDIKVTDDLMDAYPVRNGGPGFPKDLHFFGELISRKKIKISVEFTPIDTKGPAVYRFGGNLRIDFLATTGELLNVRLAPPDALAELGVRQPDALSIEGTDDFTPPVFFSASRRLATARQQIPGKDVTTLVEETWRELAAKVGTKQPRCYLICDNLNAPSVVAAEVNKLARNAQWAGISRRWCQDLPFDPAKMERLARDKRGISILAISGGVEIQIQNIDARASNDSAASRKAENTLAPLVDECLGRMPFPKGFPDHAVFLLAPTGDSISRAIDGQLRSRMQGLGEVFPCYGLSTSSGSANATYLNGHAFTNAPVLLVISGFLPLTLDSASLLRRAPPKRLISWEVSQPITDLADSFGPHPMQELFDRLGIQTIRLFQQAQRIEAIRIKSNTPEDWSVPGKPNVDGHEIINRKQLGPDFAKQFAEVILNENNWFGGGGVIKGCIWAPRVAFRVTDNKQTITVLVCFDCNSAMIQFRDASGKTTGSVGFDFDENVDAFAQIAKRAFPSDPVFKKANVD